MILTVQDTLLTRNQLYPFAEIRSVVDIRVGILTIREKWEKLFGSEAEINPANEGKTMAGSFPSNLVPSKRLADAVKNGTVDSSNYMKASTWRLIQYPWHIIDHNDWAIHEDYQLLTKGRFSEPIPESVQAIKSTQIFIEEGARLHHCILNAETGPIYIGKNTLVMEGSVIRGPFALCEGAVVKMGTRIYGGTTVGPFSVVGGEIKNSIIFGYSNKAHDGYLGDSVVGEWCNIGAGTSNSNIKNTASEIKIWHQPTKEYMPAGLKCGLIMGDYTRCAINTSFNTGTVAGIASNIFGAGLTPKYIPDFSWGSEGKERYQFEKAIEDIRNWKKLKNKELSDQEIQTLKSIFALT